jgi:hypothetical protein
MAMQPSQNGEAFLPGTNKGHQGRRVLNEMRERQGWPRLGLGSQVSCLGLDTKPRSRPTLRAMIKNENNQKKRKKNYANTCAVSMGRIAH